MQRKVNSILIILLLGLTRLWGEDPFQGWNRTETEHFTFIYEQRDTKSVEELLTYCEEVYDLVTGYFESYPDNIKCVIWGGVDSANGSYAAFPHRINLIVTSPSNPWLGSRTENWLKVLLIHELTHYVHLSYNKGFFHVLGKIFGEDLEVAQGGLQPGWMIEGIAVALETVFSEGGRGRNPFFELYWKAPILENNLFTLRQASYMSPYPPGGRIYVAGYMIVSYMMETYGREVFSNIHREFTAFPLLGPRGAFKKVTGSFAGEMYDAMVEKLKKEYAVYRDFPRGRQISPKVTGNYYMPLITDAGWYLYRHTPEKAPALVLYDAETQEETVLFETSLTDEQSLTATRDGLRLYFTSLEYKFTKPRGQTSVSDLFRWDKAANRVVQITEGGHVWHPAVSPDGKTIVAVQRQHSYSRLVEIDESTGVITPLFTAPGTTVYTPSFSPDGSNIVFALNHEGTQDIWLFDRTDGSASPLYEPDNCGEYNPKFIDSDTILFSGDKEGDLRLYIFTLSTGKRREVVKDRIGAYIGDVQGKSLYYGSYSSDGYCILKTPLTEEAAAASLPEPPSAATERFTPPPSETVEESRRYIDFPKPLAWAPVPAYLDPFNSHLPNTFGIGIFSYGASYLQKSEWYGYITFPFTVFQPGVFLRSTWQLWRFRMAYSYNQVYRQNNSDYYQHLGEEVSLTLPIVGTYRLGRSTSLSLTTGLSHSFSLWRDRPFHLFNWFNFNGFETRQRLYWYNGGGFSTAKGGSPREIFSPLSFFGSARVSLPLPINNDAPSGFAVYNTLKLQVPSPFQNQFIRFGAKTNYTTPSLLGSRQTAPRGAFDPEQQPFSGSTLFALDYLFSLALLDRPLPIGDNMFGFNLQGVALGLHGEIITDWEAGTFTLDEYIYTGVEVILDLGVSLASRYFGFGLSFRFDRTLSRQVSFLEDFRPYFFIGLDSFTSTEWGIHGGYREH